MSAIVSRHADTPLSNVPHSRRRVTFQDFALGELIDDIDEVKMLIDPQSAYAQLFAYSKNRQIDDLIVTAFTGNSISVANDDTTSNVALPSAQQIANGGTGLTLAKLRQAKQILDTSDVPDEDRYFVYSPIGLQQVLADSQLTSTDYNSVRALERGGVENFLGFRWIKSTRLTVASSIRTCIAWHKNGMGLGILLDKSVEVDKRPDKNNSTQVLLKLTAGAVRIEEALVVQLDIDETK